VHISVAPLPQKSDVMPEFASTASDIARNEARLSRLRTYGFLNRGMRTSSSTVQPCKPTVNTTFALDWRNFYNALPVEVNKKTEYLDSMVPNKRIVYNSGSYMALFSATCRQIYHEVDLLPYSANEFSFCSSKAFNAWLDARSPKQARAIEVLWLNVEWANDETDF